MAQRRICSESKPNKCTHRVWIRLREYIFRWWSEITILTLFESFLATKGPKLGKRQSKANQFWTLNFQMYTPNLQLIEWFAFPHHSRKHGMDAQTDGRSPLLSPPNPRIHQRGEKERGPITTKVIATSMCDQESSIYSSMRFRNQAQGNQKFICTLSETRRL